MLLRIVFPQMAERSLWALIVEKIEPAGNFIKNASIWRFCLSKILLYFKKRVIFYVENFIMDNSAIKGFDTKGEQGFVYTKLDAAINWVRANSVWPQPMGLACCAIELMAVGGSRFDIGRFGMEVMRFSPRQADCMIVAGTVTYKMAGAIKRIYDQMTAPKWVIAMGACASSGGMFRTYSTLQGVDRIIPVDIYISGCPPRPEALLDAMVSLQNKIRTERSAKNLFSAK